MMRQVDLVIIGGGAAGMAAAVSAYDQGIRDILILERSEALGGVLHQCIHNGFGLHRFHEDLTGVEFAQRYMDMVEERKIPYMLRSFVIELTEARIVTVVNPEEGLIKIQAKAIVLAMGCRERSRNALLIPGTRGAGILTAGTAQRYLNISGYLPGKRVVILGSGDIGLIMARQFILEGVEVAAVVEIMPYSAGLARNMKQCIEDFDIPVYYNSTVTKIEGRERVTSVTVSEVDVTRRPISGTEFEIPCDTLMISAGLIPENELSEQAGIALSDATKGAIVSEDNQTSVPGIFACGNVLHVHDLVDFVAEEGEATGREAADYLSGRMNDAKDYIKTIRGNGVGGLVPQCIHRETEDAVSILFRPTGKFSSARIVSRAGENELTSQYEIALSPGEMCKVTLTPEQLALVEDELLIEVVE